MNRIQNNTMHYIGLFSQAIDNLLPQPNVDLPPDDVIDVLLEQRRAQRNQPDQAPDPARVIPAELSRRYEVHIAPLAKAAAKVRPVRSILAEDIGLVVVKGMVT